MADVKDSVMAVQICHRWVLQQHTLRLGVVRIPTDQINYSSYKLLIECCLTDLEVGSSGSAGLDLLADLLAIA